MPHPNRLQPRILRPPTPRHLEDLLRHIHEPGIDQHLFELARDEHVEAHFIRGVFEQLEPVEDLAVGRVFVVVGFGVEVEFGELDVAAGFDCSAVVSEGG